MLNFVFKTFCLFTLLFTTAVQAQQIEYFILTEQLDSARFYLNISEDKVDSDYTDELKKLSSNQELSFKQYHSVINHWLNDHSIKKELVYNFVENKVIQPAIESGLIYAYIETKWLVILSHSEDGQFDQAIKKNNELLSYVANFNPNSRDVKRAKILLSALNYIQLLISVNSEDGINLCSEQLKIAEKVQDTNLIVMIHYFWSEYYILEQNLDQFFYHTNLAISLDEERNAKSPFYSDNVVNLVDALCYTGGEEKKVFLLLENLFLNDKYKNLTYSYFPKLLSSIDTNSLYCDKVFDLFEADNVVELASILESRGSDECSPNEYRYIVMACGRALHHFGRHEESTKFMERAIYYTSQVYSEKFLAQISEIETQKLRQQKEAEVKEEKLITRYTIIIATISLLLLVITLIAFIRRRKREKLLKQKNILIDGQKAKLEEQNHEKELLLREIHHRVKNNFQIVSSLLELQTKGIDDEKAKNLAIEGKNRVQSMALIHQTLYQNDDLKVNFDEYILSLITSINRTFNIEELKININLPKDFIIDIDTAIPLGLVVNELITNSFKYTFVPQKSKKLNVELEKGSSEHCLIIDDFGAGLPKDLNIKNSKSIGLRLIKRLSKQLQGRFENDQSLYKIYFKDEKLKQEID